MEAVLDTRFSRTRPSRRIQKLVALIKAITKAGEQFIIVTDHIWLALVAMKVQFSYIALIERHVSPSRFPDRLER
jgi:hypothetical protein